MTPSRSGDPAVAEQKNSRSVLTYAHLTWLWSTLAIGLIAAWVAVLLLPGMARRWSVLRAISRLILASWGISLSVKSVQDLTGAPGPYLYVVNHSSYMDMIVLTAVLRGPFAFVAKMELTRPAWLGFFLRRIGTIFVDRAAVGRNGPVLMRVIRAAAHGQSVVVFPEGTFAEAPGLRPFHDGAFVTAVRAGIPTVPIAVSGTRRLWPKGSFHPTPTPISVTLGSPLLAPAVKDGIEGRRGQVEYLHRHTRAFILREVGELDLDSNCSQ